jgi:flagellar assembly protein FliH
MAESPQKKIQLHYFPDILVGTSTVNPGCASERNSFKRIHFDSSGPSCSGTTEVEDDQESARPSSSTDDIEERAFQNGFQEGEKSALESHSAEVASAVTSLKQAVTDIQNLRQEIYHSIEHEVVELALSIARKVVCQEIKTNKDVVVCVAREALSQVEVPGKIKIRLNPADLEFITETRAQISGLSRQIENVTFEAEEGIASGGCVIETKLGEIDARIEKQFQIVEDRFRDEFARSEPERNPDDNP